MNMHTMRGSTRLGVAICCALATLGWLGAERDRAAEGNAHYEAGRYGEAEASYGEGLVDYPESDRLRFNLAAAQYREGKFADAIATLEKLLPPIDGAGGAGPAEDGDLIGEAAYNIGNARFRLGEQVEEQDPQQALALYDQALGDYKRAMGFAPEDEAPKFNHEFVEQHLRALKERLEQEKQQQQEQPPQDQPQDQAQDQSEDQPGDQPEDQPEDQSGQSDQQRDEAAEQQQNTAQQQREEPEPGKEHEPPQDMAGGDQQDEGQQERAQQDQARQPDGAGPQHAAQQAGGEAGEDSPDRMSRSEAQALVDTARGEEVEPSELRPLVEAAGIGEPRQDW